MSTNNGKAAGFTHSGSSPTEKDWNLDEPELPRTGAEAELAFQAEELHAEAFPEAVALDGHGSDLSDFAVAPGEPTDGDIDPMPEDYLERVAAEANDMMRSELGISTEPVAEGRKEDEVEALVASAPPPTEMRDWAYIGPIGEWVRRVSAVREPGRPAMLISALAAIGNMAGRTAYAKIDAGYNYANIFAVLVGSTGKGRKGASWRVVANDLIRSISRYWLDNRVCPGVGSGEAIVHAVRNPTPAFGKRPGDPGVADKRLFLIEEEFARLMAVAGRKDSTVSPTLRELYDKGAHANNVKTNPASCSRAHVSILGHITPKELRSVMRPGEVSNGFANRFIFIHAVREKQLAEGGEDVDVSDVTEVLRKNVEAAYRRGEFRMRLTDEGRELWGRIYKTIDGGSDDSDCESVADELTVRGSTHVIRLALIYAIADGSDMIDATHLRAALAVWEYARRTALWAWSSSGTGVQAADRIYSFLMSHANEWVSDSEIYRRFKYTLQRDREFNLGILRAGGLVEFRTVETKGRRRTEWRPIGKRSKVAAWDGLFGEGQPPEYDPTPTYYGRVEPTQVVLPNAATVATEPSGWPADEPEPQSDFEWEE